MHVLCGRCEDGLYCKLLYATCIIPTLFPCCLLFCSPYIWLHFYVVDELNLTLLPPNSMYDVGITAGMY